MIRYMMASRAAAPVAALGALAPAALDLAERLADVARFADRHPDVAMEAGLGPVALEARIILAGGALGRVAGSATRGARPAEEDLAAVRRAADLGWEAWSRAARYEADVAERPGRRLGETVQTVFSVATSVVWIVMAFM